MAIDADLSTGVITEMQARERRDKISRESEFYGSMDGATKFVKGDAIVAIILSIVNIIGGLIIGLMTGVDDVVSTYTIATVGDGLVSQIPALLISTATGMIVTRAASENSLSKDVITQFSRIPITLIIAGGATLAMMIIPGMPVVFPSILGAGMIILGIVQLRNQSKALKAAEDAEAAMAEEPALTETEIFSDPKNIAAEIEIETIEVQFGYSLLSLFDEQQGSNFSERLISLKRKFAKDMGVVIQGVLLRDNIQITPNSYVITIRGEQVAGGELLPNYYLIMDSTNTFVDIDGIDTVDPAFGIPAKWIPASSVERAEMHGYAIIDAQSVIITHLSDVLRRHAHELIGRNEIDEMLENVRKTHRTLVDDLIGVSMPVAAFQKIITNLLREQVPVKDLVTILETISEYNAATGGDLDMLTEYCRQALKRTITRLHADDGMLNAVFLDIELEAEIVKNAQSTAGGLRVKLDPSVINGMITSLFQHVSKFESAGITPVVLTSPMVRPYFKQMADQFIPGITVLSTGEIDPRVQIQSFGTITSNNNAA
jgi:flagellar biosynthesis protein FlhA